MFVNICLVFAIIATVFDSAIAKTDPVTWKDCKDFTVHGGTSVAFNGEKSFIQTGNIGMSPGTSVTGNYFNSGSLEVNSTPANACASDRRTAYNELRKAECTTEPKNELGGQTLKSPNSKDITVFCDSGSGDMTVSSDLTLSGEGIFIFQASSNLMTKLNTEIKLDTGAKAENIFWVVGKSATLGTTSAFKGTIIADASIGLQTGATVDGQALAGAAVTFESSNTMTNPTVSPKQSQAVLGSKSESSEPILVGGCEKFAVHGGSKVEFGGGETLVKTGNVGMAPGTSISGKYSAPQGSTEINSDLAKKCADDRTITYNNFKGMPCGTIHNELGGLSLEAGVYCDAGASMTISSDLTLKGGGNFIFQASSSFLQNKDTKIILDGVKPENVFFAVSSSATIGAGSKFQGTMIAYASISIESNVEVVGQTLAGAAVSFSNSGVIQNPRVVKA